ncbi:LytR/AlgR family response regulator transcription factor [Marinilactibacillus kalidii]|uniref:LytR/AlgR family response regulator transcription factor n=1 Tax=Marinilactibacillus kalidii TaxID=2820274 RepID=UPI001ABEE7D6|nr:LytTR family DNA-binding domain-containing protein [Marinilactibacillus kalidii]
MTEKLTIAIVDDETIQIESMKSLIKRSAETLNLSVELLEFSSGEAFLFELEDHKAIDIVFLDIEMNQLDGLDVAKKIRETEQGLTIVFATAFAEYAVQGYDVQAMDYLLKPIHVDKIERVLTRHLEKKPAIKESIMIESNGERIKLFLENILFIEVNRRECTIHLKEQIVTTNQTLKEISEKLTDDFIQTHRSYIVHVKYIDRLLKTDIKLSNGENIPLSRRLAKVVQEKFVDFNKGGVFYHE